MYVKDAEAGQRSKENWVKSVPFLKILSIPNPWTDWYSYYMTILIVMFKFASWSHRTQDSVPIKGQ